LIIADSAPLIYLSKIGRLDLLKKLFGKIMIPQGVWNEVVTEAHGRAGASELETGTREGWIKVERVTLPKRLLDEGAEEVDAEVIALAKKMKLPLLTNDRVLVTIARTTGVEASWLTQAVIEASSAKILSTREARSLLRDLVRAGLRIRSEVLAEAVHMVEDHE
jgi:predicted nucleic acid-binding protein